MLRRKMFRDIRLNMSQFITIFLMIFLGVGVYSGIRSYMDGMVDTANKFYKTNNLQDLDAIVNNFSDDDLANIKEIKGVKNVERKLVLTGTMESDENRVLQLNFIESNEISKFYVDEGVPFDKEKNGVWLDQYYANNNNLHVGDSIKIKYEQYELEEKILGLINVPDHVYDIKDESALFPNHIDYGFAYLSINELPDVVYNYLIIDVDDENNKNSVKNAIESSFNNVIAVTDIKDSVSYSAYQGEIEEGETYVGIFSGLFLFIAVLSVITTMTRVVKKQRIQIGTLKALGFKKSKIICHYVGYGFWISLFASILGLIAGPLLIGNLFIGMEMKYFQIPNGHAAVSNSSFIIALIVVVVVSIVTYLTCRSELKYSPAETLRVKLPKVNKGSLNITTKGIFKKLGFSVKWNVRDIIRNKVRTIMGIAGITGCTMLLVCAFGMLDSMNEFIRWQFQGLYNFNYKLSLNENITQDQYDNIINIYGDKTSKTLGIEIVNNNKKSQNNIFVTDAANYVRFTDKNKEYMNLSDDGIYVTQKLAKVNNYKIGDEISWHIYGDKNYYKSKIVGINRDPQNQNITMTRKYLESLGIEYNPDTVYTNKNLSDVEQIDGVEIIQDINALEKGMNNMLNTMKTMIVMLVVIAAVLGSVIIYNLGILSFTEKQYQFATLKVLGFRDRKIKQIYIKQNNWITIISIIIGLPLGFFMTDFIFKVALSDTYDFNASIKIISYLYAIIGTFVVSLFTSKILSKKVNKINMVMSLKGNE